MFTNPCEFYNQDEGCTIYNARPMVCRSYPYLSADLSGQSIAAMADPCPGQLATYTIVSCIAEEMNRDPSHMARVEYCRDHPDCKKAFDVDVLLMYMHFVMERGIEDSDVDEVNADMEPHMKPIKEKALILRKRQKKQESRRRRK